MITERRAGLTVSRVSITHRMFKPLLILALVLPWAPVRAAETPDALYTRIYTLMDSADSLSANGKPDLAKAKYQMALNQLLDLKKTNPTWNTKVVSYRVNYLSEKIA